MIRIGRTLFLIGILFLGACSPLQTPTADQTAPESATVTPVSSTPQPAAPAPEIQGISVDKVRNSEYQLGFPDQPRTVQLTDGKFQEGAASSTDYVSVTVTNFIALGDLNGDGETEAAALVAEDYGGSGTFVFLAVYQYVNDQAQFLTSIFLDDRPTINTLAIADGAIFVDATIHRKDDPMCCPSLATTRHYVLNGNNLILTDYSTLSPTGEPHTITIEAPVNGLQVSGLVQLMGNISIAPFENNLAYHIYDLGGVELSAGPITVESTSPGASGTFEKAVDLGSILNNTTIRIAVEDRNAADSSLFAMDSVFLQIK